MQRAAAVMREIKGERSVLQVVNRAPIYRFVSIIRVPRARIKIAVMVAGYDDLVLIRER